MITKDIFPIKEQLDRIESKIDGRITNKYLDIKQASILSSTSASICSILLRITKNTKSDRFTS